MNQPLVFCDIETTGGSHFSSRVLEVGAIRVEDGRVVASFKSLLTQEEPIPPFISQLTGIRDQDIVGAPKFLDIAPALGDIFDGAVFVAHNVRFDYSFLKMEFERIGVEFRPQLLCTVRLSRALFPQYRSHKLEELIRRHQLVAPSRHRAFEDADCLWQFWRLCLREFDLDTFEQALALQTRSQSVPGQLDEKQVAKLPEGPGVYIFEDEEGAPLYVGKSVSVRKRVLSHFASDYQMRTEQKLATQVKKLRGIPTHGELSALLLESDMIKDLQPKYNKALRRREFVTMVLQTQNDGFASVELEDARHIAPEAANSILAVYSTKTRAKDSLHAICSRYRLCPKLMGLENTKRECFLSQLGKCTGACVGEESPDSYNARFEQAFSRQRVATWPFRGPVLVRERHPQLDGETGYVIDNWCLKAIAHDYGPDGVSVDEETGDFDLDRYKIIKRFVENPANRRQISIISPEQYRALAQV